MYFCFSHVSKLVSLRGVLVERRHTHNDFPRSATRLTRKHARALNMRFPPNTCIELRLRDVASHSDYVTVYIKPHDSANLLGLITGSVVTFYDLEKRTSANKRTYCRFTSVTSYDVEDFLKDPLSFSNSTL